MSDNFWPTVNHSDLEQLKRQKSAQSKKLTPISINHENHTGEFEGRSKNYFVNLEQCTCMDFSMRKLPCKHQYRLAHELGLFNLGSVSTGMLKVHAPYTVEEIVSKIPEAEARFIKKRLRDFKSQPSDIYKFSFKTDFSLKHSLQLTLIFHNKTESAILESLTIAQIKDFLSLINKKPKGQLKKSELVEIISTERGTKELENWLANTVYLNTYVFNPEFDSLIDPLYSNLCRLYPNENIFW